MIIKQTRLTEEAKKSKVLLNIVFAMIMAFMFIQVGMLLGTIVVHLIIALLVANGILAQNKELFTLLEHSFSFGFILLSVFFWVKFIEKRKIISMGFYKESWIKKYITGILIGLGLMSTVVLILFMLGDITVETKSLQPVGMAALINIPIIFIGWLIQGATEEVVTRGWLMNVLGAKYNITVGLVTSALLFGALHLMNPSINYIALLNIILVGIFFGLCVIYTNSLWLVCGIHGAWNFAQGNLFGFAVSGNKAGAGTLIDLNLVGNTNITGGEFGPEAGLVCSFVLLAATLILLLLKKKGYFSKHA
jgi:hypothetical protein